jgi:hypothetical protein
MPPTTSEAGATEREQPAPMPELACFVEER